MSTNFSIKEGKSQMKKSRKLLSIVLALLMLTSLVPVTMTATVSALPTGTTVLYVKDGGTGNGVTPDVAAGSLATAFGSVATAGGGTVVICGPVTIKSNVIMGINDPNITVKVTSVYGGVDYRETSEAKLIFDGRYKNYSLKNNTDFDGLDIHCIGDSCSFFANGYRIFIGKDVNVTVADEIAARADCYPNIYGGSAFDLSATKNFPANTSVTVLGGTWNRVVGRGYGVEAKPRPSLGTAVSIGAAAEVRYKTNEGGFEQGDYHNFSGKRTVIYNGPISETAGAVPADVEYVINAVGNGYVQGISDGIVMLCAESGYGAKIGGTIYPNGEFKFEGNTLEVEFVESDINREAELAALRPKVPAAFPGEYIRGYDNGDGTFSFRPAGNITIAESATILVRLVTNEDNIAGKYTTEKAKERDWFYVNIAYLDSFEFFSTFDNFDANRQITRAEFVKMISLASNLKEDGTEIKFTDVPETHKYYNDIKLATMSKFVNGYDNGDGTFAFRPDAPITRAEVVTVINRVFDVAELAKITYKSLLPNFSDVDETHWAAYQIIAAAGGKEKPVEIPTITGSGKVEFSAEGPVIFANDVTGNAENDGLTPETAVPFGTATTKVVDGGTVVLCAPITYKGNTRWSRSANNTVLVTSVYGGVDYRAANNAAFILEGNYKNISLNGTTLVDNVAFISKGANNAIFADNHKLVIGKDVVCITDGNKSAPLNIYAGSANDLGACVNYIGSTNTTAGHTGDYFGNITINGGKWGNIKGSNLSSPAKLRQSYSTVVTVGADAEFASVSVATTDIERDGVLGLRVAILNNKPATMSADTYDAVVNVKGAATAEVALLEKDKITIKVTADDGRAISGLSADGLFEITEAGILTVNVDETSATAKFTSANGDMFIDDDVPVVDASVIAEIDKKADALLAEILATKSDIKPAEGKTAYYVSNSGNDANDGKSPETAWQTIDKVNTAMLYSGDVVYFKRGDMWRGKTLTAKSGVSYSAYGEGAKPIINRSPYDGAKTGTWTLVEGYTNVYAYSEKFDLDVGYVSFNNGTFEEIYSQKVRFALDKQCNLLDINTKAPVEKPLDYLTGDLYFWHDPEGSSATEKPKPTTLYLRSDKGNPAERFTNIEFNPVISAITANGNNITIDNLAIKHAGVHGISSGGANGLLVQHCTFEWIGGGMRYSASTGEPTRLGNGVEIYGDCDGYTVTHCYFNQIYDAGVTHQHTGEDGERHIMKNVTYSNNLFIKNHYSIEHFNRAKDGTGSYLANILYKDNISRYVGYGFGSATRPDKGSAAHIRSGTITDTVGFVVEGNIFDRSKENMFTLRPGGDEQIEWKNNTYVQYIGGLYGTIKGAKRYYTANIANEVNENFAHPEIGGNYLYMQAE